MKTIKYSIAGLMVWLSAGLYGQAWSPIAAQVHAAKESGELFNDWSALLSTEADTSGGLRLAGAPAEAVYFTYHAEVARLLLRARPERVRLEVLFPDEHRYVLELIAVPDSFYDYIAPTGGGLLRQYGPRSRLHYRGALRGVEMRHAEAQSLIAMSFSADEASGLISLGRKGSFNLGKVEGSDRHILYHDRDAMLPSVFPCHTADDPLAAYDRDGSEGIAKHATTGFANKRIKIYLETAYDIFQHKGSVTRAEHYVAALFNRVAALYQREGITIEPAELKIRTAPGPYTATTADELLKQFGAQAHTMSGHPGQLLTFNDVGSKAHSGGLCSPTGSERLGVSGIRPDFGALLSYARNVSIVAHGIGHLLGARHIAACTDEGHSAATKGKTTERKTIMNSCRGQSAVADPNVGFAPSSGQAIRRAVSRATCVGNGTGGECLKAVIVKAPVGPGVVADEEAGRTITAVNTIADGAVAIYHAGTTVTLDPGFFARPGSSFHAYNEGCTGNAPDALQARSGMAGYEPENQQEDRIFFAEEGADGGWVLYPNPTDRTLSVRGSTDDACTVTIYDRAGHPLLTANLTGGTGSLDVGGLAPGSYLIRIVNRKTSKVSTAFISRKSY